MTAQIVDINSRRKKTQEPMFMLCPDCKDDTVFAAVAEQDAKGNYFVKELQCFGPLCQGEHNFVVLANGYVQEEE